MGAVYETRAWGDKCDSGEKLCEFCARDFLGQHKQFMLFSIEINHTMDFFMLWGQSVERKFWARNRGPLKFWGCPGPHLTPQFGGIPPFLLLELFETWIRYSPKSHSPSPCRPLKSRRRQEQKGA